MLLISVTSIQWKSSLLLNVAVTILAANVGDYFKQQSPDILSRLDLSGHLRLDLGCNLLHSSMLECKHITSLKKCFVLYRISHILTDFHATFFIPVVRFLISSFVVVKEDRIQSF